MCGHKLVDFDHDTPVEFCCCIPRFLLYAVEIPALRGEPCYFKIV